MVKDTEVSKMARLARLQLCLAIVVMNITLSGYGGGQLTPIRERIRAADLKFDTAEAFPVHADEETEGEERRVQVKQRKALYNDALEAYQAIIKTDSTGKYALRCLWQISEIYNRRGESDNAMESYEAILAVAPEGYYADTARSAIADICKYRQLVQEESRKYETNRELYAQYNLRQHYDQAAGALFNVAVSHEKLSNYPEAITHYTQVVDEFPDYENASKALMVIGDIHFYKLYDYDAAFPVYLKVIELYPATLEAATAFRQMKHTDRDLRGIARCQTQINEWRTGKTVEYAGFPGNHKITEMHPDAVEVVRALRQMKHTHRELRYIARNQSGTKCRNEESPTILRYLGNSDSCLRPMTDVVAQNYQEISLRWECLRNFPAAILAYRNSILVNQPGGYLDSSGDVRTAYSRYRMGRLFQLTGQLERAIEAYQEVWDKHRDSFGWRAKGVYQQAVCYREMSEFTKAYKGFKTCVSLGPDAENYQEAERIVRQFEMDRDGDGYKSYIEKDAGTSDKDPNDQPRL
jgi:tetratricopeptide (TPR) repeat protein